MATPLNKKIPALDTLMKRRFMGTRRVAGSPYRFIFE